MVKAKKQKPSLDGIVFDSNEELEFYHWCLEAKKYKIISDFKYNCESYQLSPKQTTIEVKQLKTKTKTIKKHLLYEHSYKPDFHLFKGERWSIIESSHNLWSLHGYNNEFVIDVKGTFQQNDGSRSFSINQKWMFNRYHIYVNKVIPEKFFQLTWVPEKCKLSPKRKKLREKYKNIPTLFEKYGNFKPKNN